MRNFGKIFLLFVFALLILLSCNGHDPIEIIDNHDHTRTFLFAIRGYGPEERFAAKTSDPDLLQIIDDQLSLPESKRLLHIHGTIDWGNGGHNLNWSWHFVPDEWVLAEFSIELCDGIPSYVENDLKYWIETVGSFCPWSSYVLTELK
jgi:hypothetical protein